MTLCSNGHDEVCYETSLCPACEYGERKYEEGYAQGCDDGGTGE